MTQHKDKPLKIVAKDDILTDILTLAIVITMVGATLIYVAPGFIPEPEVTSDTVSGYQEPTGFSPVREHTEIEILINDIILHNPARKAQYARNPDSVDDVHVCANMAVDQAGWIIENYDYNVGIVILHNKHLGDNHMQTWVDVNETRYVIDSTSNYYWNVEKHESQWGHKYKIQYTTLKKGQEIEKENNEWLNNKNESQSGM